jgi:rare lipoprotein A
MVERAAAAAARRLSGALLGAALSASLLSACAVPPSYRVAPTAPVTATPLPGAPPDISRIPDAVPRDEARSSLGNPPFYEVAGRRYVVLPSAAGYVERGIASWYGPQFHGLRTATGESYDMFAMTAAHKTLPLPCYARVINLSNGRSIIVRINDRGPFVGDRIIDLSYTAAAKLDMIRNGTAFVQVETLSATPAPAVSLPVSTPMSAAASLGPSSAPSLTPRQLAALPASPASPASTAPEHPAALPAAPTPASAGAAALYIQVGAFAASDHAQHAVQRLRAAGVRDAFMLGPDIRHTLLRVRIGPIASVQQYDALIGQLRSLGFSGARLAQD